MPEETDNRTFGLDPKENAATIELLQAWYVCSFCRRKGEVRPYAKMDAMGKFKGDLNHMRLCYDCGDLQEKMQDPEFKEKIRNMMEDKNGRN